MAADARSTRLLARAVLCRFLRSWPGKPLIRESADTEPRPKRERVSYFHADSAV